MDLQKVHPELREKFKRFPKLPLHNRFIVRLVSLFTSLTARRKSYEGVRIEDHSLGLFDITVYQPEIKSSGAGILWVHGGGLMMGSTTMNDPECARYVSRLGVVVVSVNYRLAPKHVFPAAIDDCLTAWQWFQDNCASLGVDEARIAVAGQSAGGGLAASLVQRLHDLGGVQPVAQGLFCPMLDDRTAVDTSLDKIKHFIWNNKSNRAGWSSYLGADFGADMISEYAAPGRRQDLSGLPPAWIGVGDIDLFYSENNDYCQRLQQAGVEVQLDVVPMAPHGFETLVAEANISKVFWESHFDFLRQKLLLDAN